MRIHRHVSACVPTSINNMNNINNMNIIYFIIINNNYINMYKLC